MGSLILAIAALCEVVAEALAAVFVTPAAVEAGMEVEVAVMEAVEATDATLLDALVFRLSWLVMLAVRPVAFVQPEPTVVFEPATKLTTAH